MRLLSATIVLGLLMAFAVGGCINIKAPEKVNIGGDEKDVPQSNSKAEWKEFGKSYYSNNDE